MHIEKSEIASILDAYKSTMKRTRTVFWGPHPAIKGAEALLQQVEGDDLTELQQFNLAQCFIDYPLTAGGGSEIAYHSLLSLLRVAHSITPLSANDPQILAEVPVVAQCLNVLKTADCLGLQAFFDVIGCPNPQRVFSDLSRAGITPAEIKAIISNLIPQRNTHDESPFRLLLSVPDISRTIVSNLPLQDKKSLSQTEWQLRLFVKKELKKQQSDLKSLIKAAKEEFKAFFNAVLRASPEAIEALLKERPDIAKLEDLNITKCLIHLVKGEIELVEAMVEADPGLLLKKGRVMDFSERFFVGEGITLLNYALAAQAGPEVRMLVKHFLSTPGGEAAMVEQYRHTLEMLRNQQAENHPAMWSLNSSIVAVHRKLGAFKDKYGPMDRDEFTRNKERAKHDWTKVVGGAYLKLPAWVIEETMCEHNKVADLSVAVKRDRRYLLWLFEEEIGDGASGSMGMLRLRGRRGWVWLCHRSQARVMAQSQDDHEVLALCQTASPGELPALESFYPGGELPSTYSLS